MKLVIAVFVSIIVLLMFGCTKQVDTQADTQSLKNFMEDMDIAFNAGDSETLASFYTEDAIRMEPNEPAWVGNDAIRAGFTRWNEQYDFLGDDLVEDVRVVGDWAFMRGIYTGKSTLKTGGEPIHEKGKWMSFLQRQPDGSWKIVSDIFNSDLPQPEGTN